MTTKTTTKSLLDRFNNAEKTVLRNGNDYYPERNLMERQLQRLLGSEVEYNMRYSNQADIETLQEFKENFEWETKYGVCITWEIEPSTATQLIECSSADDMAAYLSGAKEPECPAFEDIRDDIDYGCELTGDCSTDARINVSNLRPKQEKVTKKYLVNLVLESDSEVTSLEEHLHVILGQSSVIKQAQVCSITADT